MATMTTSSSAIPSTMRSHERETPSSSGTPSRSLSLNADEESVMIAVRALDDMRSGVSSIASSSSTPLPYQNGSGQSRASSLSDADIQKSVAISDESQSSGQFVSRVSGLPIVNTALRAYEQGKASSRVVKYGAEMVESSVWSISRPVIDRLPVNQLDDFACRQLDRFGRTASPASTDIDRERTPNPTRTGQKNGGTNVQEEQANNRISKAKFRVGDEDEESHGSPRSEGAAPTQTIANRSLLQTILYEASGISVAVSTESMRSLKFCLQWLQYATDHTDGQILVLRNFIASLNAAEGEDEERPISASHMQTLTNVKRDVVHTVRQVVDVVSKYAGGALPEPARSRVRQFVLLLPRRWANSSHRVSARGNAHRRAGSSNPASAASTAPPTPLQSPRLAARGLPSASDSSRDTSHRQTTTARPTAGSAAQAAQRILTLATESLDMMRNVNAIFKESLDRADVWVDRLRTVGIQRHQKPDGTIEEISPNDLRRIASDALIASNGALSASESSTSTATFTSFPPSPRNSSLSSSTVASPSSSSSKLAALSSLDVLTLASSSTGPSGFATPKSGSTASLSGMGGYDWELTARKLQTIRDKAEHERRAIDEKNGDDERSAASALSALRAGAGSRARATPMDIDAKE